MTDRQRTAARDPLDDAVPPLISATQNTTAERDRARDTITRHAVSIRDLYQLLGALGLDQADEISAQAARCQQGDQT